MIKKMGYDLILRQKLNIGKGNGVFCASLYQKERTLIIITKSKGDWHMF